MKQLICILLIFFNILLFAQRFEDSKAFSNGSAAITCVKYSPDGKLFATGNADGTVLVRDTSDKITTVLKAHKSDVLQFQFNKTGEYFSQCQQRRQR